MNLFDPKNSGPRVVFGKGNAERVKANSNEWVVKKYPDRGGPEIQNGKLVLTERAEDVSVVDIRSKTEAEFLVSNTLKTIKVGN